MPAAGERCAGSERPGSKERAGQHVPGTVELSAEEGGTAGKQNPESKKTDGMAER